MRTLILSAALALVALASAPAHAQTPRPERPYRGLFGGGYGDTEEMLSLSASFSSGYDGNVYLGAPGQVNLVTANRPTSSTIQSGSFGLAYTLSRKRVSFSASGGGSATYYASLPHPLYPAWGGGIGGSAQLSSHTTLSVNGNLSYAPLSLLPSFPLALDQSGLLANQALNSTLPQTPEGQAGTPAALNPTPVAAPSQNSSTQFENHLLWISGVGLAHQLNRRVGLSFGYSGIRSTSPSNSNDLSTQTASGSLSYAIAKGLALSIGYGQTRATYGTGADHRHNTSGGLLGGIDANRAISLSRRSTLGFGVGSTAFSDGSRVHYFVTGHVEFNREIGRSWNAALMFSRNGSFVETFQKPVLSNYFSLSLGGLISRTIQLHASASASNGAIGLTAAGNSFTAYSAGIGMSFALTRSLALGVDYFYYRYAFDNGVVLPVGLSNRTNRQSIRASVNLWEPLFHRTRRPDAAR